MRELVRRRVESVGGSVGMLFEDTALLDKLILESGGQPRVLILLIRDLLLRGLPITGDRVSRVLQQSANGFRVRLRREHYEMLKSFRGDPDHNWGEGEEDRVVTELLEMRALLQYRNGEPWFGVNPLIPAEPDG